MIEQKVTTKNLVGETLVGVENRPDAEQGKYPTVILVHGFYGNRDEHGMFTQFANELTTSGFVVYRFDLSGCGESEGDYSSTTLTKLAEDVRSILDFARARPIVEQSKIGLVGFSLGATTILALRPKDIRCLALIGSVARPYEVLQLLFGEGFHPSGMSSRVTSSGARVEVGSDFWADFQRYNIPKEMGKISVPTLFLHGEFDYLVPLEESKILFAAASEPKELVVVPGDEHDLKNSLAREKLVEWCKKFLE